MDGQRSQLHVRFLSSSTDNSTKFRGSPAMFGVLLQNQQFFFLDFRSSTVNSIIPRFGFFFISGFFLVTFFSFSTRTGKNTFCRLLNATVSTSTKRLYWFLTIHIPKTNWWQSGARPPTNYSFHFQNKHNRFLGMHQQRFVCHNVTGRMIERLRHSHRLHRQSSVC